MKSKLCYSVMQVLLLLLLLRLHPLYFHTTFITVIILYWFCLATSEVEGIVVKAALICSVLSH